MLLPELHGNKPTTEEFIFTAADSIYFDIHGVPLINSVLKNTQYSLHIHIYNPSQYQLDYFKTPRVTVSYEYVNPDNFDTLAKQWYYKKTFDNKRQKEMTLKGNIHGIVFLSNLIEKTYYACCRFYRLSQVMNFPSTCLAIDVDGVARRNFSMHFKDDHDVFLYQKKCGGHLAGALLLTEQSEDFLVNYSQEIKKNIENDNVYWFMDQVVLDEVIPKYNKGLLPMSYIDWEMNLSSAIWSAKGPRKNLDIFRNEQKKYE